MRARIARSPEIIRRPDIIEWIWQPTAALRFREQDGQMLLEQLFAGTAYHQDTRYEWRRVPVVTQAEADQWQRPVLEVSRG